MTDKELSMKFVLNYPKIEKGELLTTMDLQNAFLAGLGAGRPKWHRVADGDLPEEGVEVLNDDGVKVILIKGHWRYVYGGEWEDDAYLDHWCEIPKYTEE